MRTAFGKDTEIRKHMGTHDEAFAKGYSDLCLSFKTSWYGGEEEEDQGLQLMDACDLLGGGTEADPPRELMISVRVLSDEIGEIETVSGGRMSLNKGSQYYLAREDVENLVVMGALEIIE